MILETLRQIDLAVHERVLKRPVAEVNEKKFWKTAVGNVAIPRYSSDYASARVVYDFLRLDAPGMISILVTKDRGIRATLLMSRWRKCEGRGASLPEALARCALAVVGIRTYAKGHHARLRLTPLRSETLAGTDPSLQR